MPRGPGRWCYRLDGSIHFEHLLLGLDSLHPDGPSLYPLAGDAALLLCRLEEAVDRMLVLGGDRLALEILLAEAREPCPGC